MCVGASIISSKVPAVNGFDSSTGHTGSSLTWVSMTYCFSVVGLICGLSEQCCCAETCRQSLQKAS